VPRFAFLNSLFAAAKRLFLFASRVCKRRTASQLKLPVRHVQSLRYIFSQAS